MSNIPYVIANVVEPSSPLHNYGGFWNNHLEIYIAQIDSFSAITAVETPSKKADLNVLKSIAESDIKNALAEIIGEPTIPKDCGGESSDLFTCRITLNGRPISTAFLHSKAPQSFIQ